MTNSWPEDRPFAVALSHDVDRVAKRWQFFYYILLALRARQARILAEHGRSLRALLQGDDPYWNFRRIMTLEEQLRVRSTFFFLNESGRVRLADPQSLILFAGRYRLDDSDVQEVITALDAGGWEIGLHGSYHSYRDLGLLKREKAELEGILGHRVLGIRQHYLNLKIPETWRNQARLGLQYDSTLGYSDRVGFRWKICRPFYPLDPLTGERLPVLQIPIGIMEGALMRHSQPWQVASSVINHVQEAGGVLTLNWHQRVFNPWEFAAYRDTYVAIIRECRSRGAWITTLESVANWYQNNSREQICSPDSPVDAGVDNQ